MATTTSRRIERGKVHRIEKATGVGFTLEEGEMLRVIDPYGGQVSDLFCVGLENTGERLNAGRTFDYEETIRLSRGNQLWSNRSRPMLRILEDTCGTHDFLLTPCSEAMYRILYDVADHANCLDNLSAGLEPWDVVKDDIGCSFNIFMNVPWDASGAIRVLPPLSKAGDSILFEVLTDLAVALTACPSETTNGGSIGPIDFEIIPSATRS